MEIVVVAELACNHGGDMEKAREMIRRAASAGADYAKLQYFHTDEDNIIPKNSTLYPMVKRAELSLDQIGELKDFSTEQGTGFLCTPFKNPERAHELRDKLGIEEFKVRELDGRDEGFIEALLPISKKLFISRTMIPIDISLMHNPKIQWLFCIPSYPPMPSQMDLSRVGLFDGLSDHFPHNVAALASAAVAQSLGRRNWTVEKHLCLDHMDDVLDKEVSIDFVELAGLVKDLKRIGEMGGRP